MYRQMDRQTVFLIDRLTKSRHTHRLDLITDRQTSIKTERQLKDSQTNGQSQAIIDIRQMCRECVYPAGRPAPGEVKIRKVKIRQVKVKVIKVKTGQLKVKTRNVKVKEIKLGNDR